MKMLTAVLMLVLAISSFASSDSQTFTYDGSQDGVTLNLQAEKTHIEYRYEQRREICYRQEVYYQTVCHSTPQGRFCQTIPHYREIPYSCIRTVQIPYEVHDYYTQAAVNISVANMSEMATPGEAFKATLNGDELSLSVKGSKKFIILLKKKNISAQMNGSVKMITASYATELVEAAPVVNALNVTDISMKDSVLSFKMGPVAARSAIGFALTIKKNPILGSSTVLFDRELSSSEIMINSESDYAAADVNIQKLGVKLGSGRHTLTARAFFKHEGSVLNASDFDELEASRTLIFKTR